MGFRVCFQDGLRFKVVFEPFSPLEEEICCDLLFGAKPLRYWYYWFLSILSIWVACVYVVCRWMNTFSLPYELLKYFIPVTKNEGICTV